MEQQYISNTNEVAHNKEINNQLKFERRDYIFLLLSFVVGFAFCEFILLGGLGIGVPLFFAVFYPVAAIYLSRKHNIISKSSIMTFLPVSILLFCFVFFDNLPLRFFNVIVLWGCTILNLLAMAGLESRPMFWAGFWFDVLKATFYMPFNRLSKCIDTVFGSFKKSRKRNVGVVLLTMLGISPVVVIVLALLASSDAGFAQILNRSGNLLTGEFWEYFWKVILAVLIAFPLFNFLYALGSQNRQEKHPLEGFMLKLSGLNSLATISALGVFSFIYVIYIALQADYFFSAMRGVLPASFTYAEYARRGFFELVAVVFINFCLIAIAVIFTKRQNGRLTKGCLIPLLILAACTLLLVITATSKMVMYMQNYGLTPLRVYTSWFMILLGITTLFIMLKLILPKFDFYRFTAIVTISLYLALNVINVDSLIASYNINQYHQTGKLDIQIFNNLSDSAIPEIATLTTDGKYGTDIKELIKCRISLIDFNYWQNFSVAEYEAVKAMK